MKRQTTNLETIFVKHISNKGLVSRIIIVKLNSCNSSKTYNPIKKWAKDVNRKFTKEDTYMMANMHIQ